MRRAAAVLAAVVLSSACFEAHAPPDAGLGDAGYDPACHIGVHRACLPGCPPCPEGSYCHGETSVCFRFLDTGEWSRESCSYDGTPPRERYAYCGTGMVCAVDAAQPRSPGTLLGGRCVHPSYCAEAPDHGIDLVCTYFDFSVYMEGPPELDPGECVGGHPLGGLCGPYCETDGCQRNRPERTTDMWDWAVSCVGVGETRGLGACSLGGRICTRDSDPLPWLELVLEEDMVCLNTRQPGGSWDDVAWPVFAETCRLYASRYPDEARCLDGDWQPAPP